MAIAISRFPGQGQANPYTNQPRQPPPGYVFMPPSRYGYNPRFLHSSATATPVTSESEQQGGSQPQQQNQVTTISKELGISQAIIFDGKRMRKSLFRRTVDYFTPVVRVLQNRVWQRDDRDAAALQPDALYYPDICTPAAYEREPQNCVLTKFVRVSTNKVRCPIFTCAWTPDGRRLVTGASSGEFTLWNGLTFNFETILQAHDAAIRAMIWSHNDNWMLTGDQNGYLKYWQINMNNVKMYQAHRESIRGLTFCSSDSKFASCADDGTVRIWDFARCYEEKVLRGHGADVKCIAWHPHNSLIVSGSKDSQQPMKVWDARSGQSLATVHAHKNTVCDVAWNNNGNWLLTASRDHLVKLFDVRNFKEEVTTFKGHKKEVQSLAWHPLYEGLFSSGGADGSILYWSVDHEQEIGSIESAHDQIIWQLEWHPVGHILASSANDHTTKFWTRNKTGDQMKDKYNLNLLPIEHELDIADIDEAGQPVPGLTLQAFANYSNRQQAEKRPAEPTREPIRASNPAVIPGLDLFDPDDTIVDHVPSKVPRRLASVPRPVPVNKNFEKAWKTGAKRPIISDPAKNMAMMNQIRALRTARPPLQNPSPIFPNQQLHPPQWNDQNTRLSGVPPRQWRPKIPPQQSNQQAYWRGVQPAAIDLPGGGRTSSIDVMDDFHQKRMDEMKEWDPMWQPGKTEVYVDHYQAHFDPSIGGGQQQNPN